MLVKGKASGRRNTLLSFKDAPSSSLIRFTGAFVVFYCCIINFKPKPIKKIGVSSLLDLPLSVKDVAINVGSNIDPIMLADKKYGPCAHNIAVEPIVGYKIPFHRQLSVLPAAVSSMPGVMSMRIYNENGVSSSLAKPAMTDYWNSEESRGDGRLAIVPVITLSSLLNSIPKRINVAFLMTDIQGYDFMAIKEARNTLKERVTHIMTEVWYDDVYTYSGVHNDLCRDWLPLMTELGYTLVKTAYEEDMQKLKTRCKKQLKDNPQRPSGKEHAGLSEDNAYWVRNDVVDQPFPEVVSVQEYDPGYAEEEYKTCV
eukprot:scaffold492_cov141-Skeletonema_menzelii.AAC.6